MRKLSHWIEGFLAYTEDTIESTYLYRKWVAISCVAAAMERKCWTSWERDVYPNMYIVLAGPSGVRKGTAMRPGRKILSSLENINIAPTSITREALIKTLHIGAKELTNPKTGEVIRHSSLSIFSEELTVFLSHKNVVLLSDLNDLYDAPDLFSYVTKNSGEHYIPNTWVNLIGGTTPELIQSALPKEAIGGGFTSRVVFVYESRKGKSIALPLYGKKELALEKDLQHDLSEIAKLTGQFSMTEEFAKRWIDWYAEQEDNPPFEDDRFAGYFSRRPTHIRKLSMIASAARSDSLVLGQEDFDYALRTLEETEVKMPKTLSGYGRSDVGSIYPRIMAFLERHGGPVTIRALIAAFYSDASIEEMEQILKTMVQMGWVKMVTIDGKLHLKDILNQPCTEGDEPPQ